MRSAADTRVELSGAPPILDASDETLLAEYRGSGDRRMFDELVRRYERELYAYLRRYLGDAEMAEDVFQLTFLQVHLKCDQFESDRRFRPWLYAIATNQAIDAQRRAKRHRMLSLDQETGDEAAKLANILTSDEAEPYVHLDRMERGAVVRQALDGLTEPIQAAVHLVYFGGMKYREAAEALSIPVGTVKSRVHTAIARLTEAWNQISDNEE